MKPLPSRKWKIITAGIGLPLLLVCLLAGFSARRGEPPLSLLKGLQPVKVDARVESYVLEMRAEDFLRKAEAELSPQGWLLASVDYASNTGLECWTLFTKEPWTIEFREEPTKGKERRLLVNAFKSPPAWLTWIQERLGLSS